MEPLQLMLVEMNHGMNFKMTQFDLLEYQDTGTANDLRDSLMERRGSDLHINAHNVQQICTLCIEVLLSAKKTWKADGKHFQIDQSSGPFNQIMKQLGLSPKDLSLEGENN